MTNLAKIKNGTDEFDFDKNPTPTPWQIKLLEKLRAKNDLRCKGCGCELTPVLNHSKQKNHFRAKRSHLTDDCRHFMKSKTSTYKDRALKYYEISDPKDTDERMSSKSSRNKKTAIQQIFDELFIKNVDPQLIGSNIKIKEIEIINFEELNTSHIDNKPRAYFGTIIHYSPELDTGVDVTLFNVSTNLKSRIVISISKISSPANDRFRLREIELKNAGILVVGNLEQKLNEPSIVVEDIRNIHIESSADIEKKSQDQNNLF